MVVYQVLQNFPFVHYPVTYHDIPDAQILEIIFLSDFENSFSYYVVSLYAMY